MRFVRVSYREVRPACAASPRFPKKACCPPLMQAHQNFTAGEDGRSFRTDLDPTWNACGRLVRVTSFPSSLPSEAATATAAS